MQTQTQLEQLKKHKNISTKESGDEVELFCFKLSEILYYNKSTPSNFLLS